MDVLYCKLFKAFMAYLWAKILICADASIASYLTLHQHKPILQEKFGNHLTIILLYVHL